MYVKAYRFEILHHFTLNMLLITAERQKAWNTIVATNASAPSKRRAVCGGNDVSYFLYIYTGPAWRVNNVIGLPDSDWWRVLLDNIMGILY